MAGTNATVEIYNGNDRVATVPVVDGKWTAPLEGLAPGLNNLVAKVGQVQSEEMSFYVYPPISFTDFNDNQWGVWIPERNELAKPDFKQETENGKANTYASIFVRYGTTAVLLLRSTIPGFATGERYRLKLRARAGTEVANFRMTVVVGENSYPVQLVVSGWSYHEVEFVAPVLNVEIKIWASPERISRTFHLDDILIYKVFAPGK